VLTLRLQLAPLDPEEKMQRSRVMIAAKQAAREAAKADASSV
jgi:hypothetical protein